MENIRVTGPPLTDDVGNSTILGSESTKYWGSRLTVAVVDSRYGNAARIYLHGGLGGLTGRLLRRCRGGATDVEAG